MQWFRFLSYGKQQGADILYLENQFTYQREINLFEISMKNYYVSFSMKLSEITKFLQDQSLALRLVRKQKT